MDTIEELRVCARRAAGVGTVSALALAGRLFVKAWEMEQRADEARRSEDRELALKDWARMYGPKS